jgi:uncharacterized protein YacL
VKGSWHANSKPSAGTESDPACIEAEGIMKQRWTFLTRILCGMLLAVAGYGAGSILWPEVELQQLNFDFGVQHITVTRLLVSLSFAMFGFAIGYVMAPVVLWPMRVAAEELRKSPPARLLGATIGMGAGLLLSTLLALPLSYLPVPFGQWLPVIVAITLAYFGATLGANSPELLLLGPFRRFLTEGLLGEADGRAYLLLDTSVIIDGRVADVAETGFLDRTLLVPRFVLAELQQIADSADSLRRNRGRRGLEVLNRLQQSRVATVEITDRDPLTSSDVDRKLLRLAEELSCPVMTNDYNLNRVAEIQGLRVLNLNELANAVKTLLLPGEHLEVEIIQEGKEHGQGVGYLDDGTMIVVEDGREHIGAAREVVVTRVLQTVAGRMIFAVLEGRPEQAAAPTRPYRERAAAE